VATTGRCSREVARGGHTIDALVTRPNEAGQQERAELGIGEPLTGDRRAISMNGWFVRTADRWATYQQ